MKKILCLFLAVYMISSCAAFFAVAEEQDKNNNGSLPSISFSVQNGSTVTRFDDIFITVDDDTDVSVLISVDGERCDNIDLSSLASGEHTAFVSAEDENGNISYKSLLFYVSETSGVANIDNEVISVKAEGDSSVYTGMLLADIRLLENRVGQFNRDYLRNSDEVLISFDEKNEHITTAVGNSVPYQSFVINTEYSRGDSVIITYTGETGNGSDICLQAWNYDVSRWDDIEIVKTGESVSIELSRKLYSYKKKMRINAVPVLKYSGEDYIYWNNDSTESTYNIAASQDNHYDLVSAGVHDFVILYLNSVEEFGSEAISWANAVCDAYPNRNVIIHTNPFLLSYDLLSSEYDPSQDAQSIWNNIVIPNENVIAVLFEGGEGIYETLAKIGNTNRNVPVIHAGDKLARKLVFNEAGQLIVDAIDADDIYPSYFNTFIYDLNFTESNRSIRTHEFHAVADSDKLGDVGDTKISLDGHNLFYISTANGDNTKYSKIYVLDEYENEYVVDQPIEYSVTNSDKVYLNSYKGVSENLHYGMSVIPNNLDNLIDDKISAVAYIGLDLLPGGIMTVSAGEKAIIDINNQVDFTQNNRLYFGVTASKYDKWNIIINYSDGTLDFAGSEDIYKLFGYPTAPKYLCGSWCGYIELDTIVSGNKNIEAVEIISDSAENNISIDYMFLGTAEMNKVRFITDEETVVSYEGDIGDTVELPLPIYKDGFVFDGWYLSPEGGERLEKSVTIAESNTNIYARFIEKTENREIVFYDKEINIERVSIGKIIFICVCLIFMGVVVCVLRLKVKKTKY